MRYRKLYHLSWPNTYGANKRFQVVIRRQLTAAGLALSESQIYHVRMQLELHIANKSERFRYSSVGFSTSRNK